MVLQFAVNTSGHAGTRPAFEKTLIPCRDQRRAAKLYPSAWQQCINSVLQATNPLESTASAEWLIALAHSTGSDFFLAGAHFVEGIVLHNGGDFQDAIGAFSEAITLSPAHEYERQKRYYSLLLRVPAFGYLAHTLWYLGHPKLAEDRMATALSVGRNADHPQSLMAALSFRDTFLFLMRDIEGVYEGANETIRLSTESRLPNWSIGAELLSGWAAAAGGDREAAQRLLAGEIGFQKAYGVMAMVYYLITAEACVFVKDYKSALTAAQKGLELTTQTGIRYSESELYRISAECLLHTAGRSRKEAEQQLERALEISRSQQARSLELRAALALGRLWADEGKRTEARAVVQRVYGAFTEGFETDDMLRARRLLDQL